MSDRNVYTLSGRVSAQEQAVVERLHSELTQHRKYFSDLEFDLFYTGGSILRAESPDIDLILFVHSPDVGFGDIDSAISTIFPWNTKAFPSYHALEAETCLKSGIIKVSTADSNLTRDIDILVVLPFEDFPDEYTVENFMTLEYPLSIQMVAQDVITGQIVTSPLFKEGLLYNVVFETSKIGDKYRAKYQGYYPGATWLPLKGDQ